MRLGDKSAVSLSFVLGLRTVCYERADVLDHLDGVGVGVGPRVLVVQAVDVGHEEEQVRVHHGGGDGREGVVVAKLDLRHGQRVVLVDDGDHAHLQQLVHGPLGVEIA